MWTVPGTDINLVQGVLDFSFETVKTHKVIKDPEQKNFRVESKVGGGCFLF